MKEIQSRMTTDHFWKELVFTYVRLEANSKTKHLTPRVLAHLKKYDDIVQADRETEWAIVEEQAHTKSVDERVEKHLRDIQVAVLFLVKQDSKDSRYRNLFTAGFSHIMRLKPKDQKDEIERMKLVLERGDYSDSFRDEQNDLLDKVLAEMDSVNEQQVSLEGRLFKQQSTGQQWKDEANMVRRDVYGDLLKFPESSNIAWANNFFRVIRKAPKLSAEAKAKKDAERAQKKLDKATAEHALATSVSVKASYRADMESAKAELDAKYKEAAKMGGLTEKIENQDGTNPA